MWGLGPLGLQAQMAAAPSVTVVAFDGSVSRETGEAMAEGLAARLVDTGRFRVLPGEWLPRSLNAPPASTDALRAAAASVGVEFLMFGRAQQVRTVVSARPIALPPPRAIPMFGPRPPTRLVPRPAAGRSSYLSVSVRVVAITTGDVVRTSVAQGRATFASPAPARPAFGGTRRGLLGVVTAVVASRRRSASKQVGGWQQAIADIASTINLSNVPRGAGDR